MSLRCQNELCRSGLFPKFVVLDFQRDGLLIGYGIKFLKLVFYSLKNVIVTGGAKELKCNLHTVEKMTKVPQGFDFSFLNDEEARKILQVLERNEELQRAEKDRISKLQKTKRDIRWLQGVTGEWFEEIQRKKFCNETDVSQMLKQPLTSRIRKGMAENDPVELQTSRSKNIPNQRNPTSIPSRLSFKSSLASLFSFRKSRKETLKLPSSGQKGCDSHAGPPVSVRGTALTKIHNSPLENQPVDSTFVPKPAGMREGSGIPPWDASLLENEFFQVLDDLDSKLAQEQFPSSVNTRTSLNYGSRTQFSHFYSSGNRHGNMTGRHNNHYKETSNMSIYDILRPGTPREGFKTFSPRTRTIYDMYRSREPRVLKEDYMEKNTFGSTSLCFDSRQRSASPATGYFTARSLYFPGTIQNRSGFMPPSHQKSPKRTPLSSIIWNSSDSSRDRQNQEEFLRAPSPMEIDPADQYMYPRCFQENRRYEFYRSQSVYQSVGLHAPMDNAMGPDPLENSENMPFYHQDNPFARSFFSNTFGQSREQRFGQGPFWGQQEEHSSWSEFHQSRKPFTSSDRDFEMTSIEANSASAGHGHSVPSQRWRSFSPSYRTDISREQEEPHPWQFDSQTSTLESMEVSQGNRNQSTHFGTPNVCSMTGSSNHIKPGGLECQQDTCPIEVHINKERYSFGIAQTSASSFKTSFPQIPDDRGNPQSPNFQNSAVTLQKVKPASLPIRRYTEVTMTNSNSVVSPPLTESQPNILVAEVNNEKDLNESILEKDTQLNKMDQTNVTSEIPQPVSQTVISNPLPDFQNPLSQDSAKSNRLVFNASTPVSSKRSPGVISSKDISKIHISHRDKANELKKDKNYTRNRKLGSAISLPFIQENRTTSSFPSPNQGCHEELTVSNEDISNIVKYNRWSSEPPENPAILDIKEEQCTTTHSTNCSKLAAGHNIPCDSLDLSSSTLPDSLSSNNSFPDALLIPSTTLFSRKSLSSKDPSLGEREEKDNDSKNRDNQFTLSPSENQKSNDNCVTVHNEVIDVVKCHSHPPFKDGKGKGKIRQSMSCTEKSSKMESRSTPTSDSRSLSEVNQSNSQDPELHTIYCTLPRQSASFLIGNRKSEGKIMASSFRNEPLPFQIKNNVEDPRGKYTSNEFSPSPESESKCSKVVSDSVSVAPEATQRMTKMKNIGSASVRKGPLPFLIKRAVSCPSGVPSPSVGRDEREKCLVSDTDASAITLRPWERIINPLESDSSIRDCSLTKRCHQKEYFQECTEKDGKISASRMGVFSLSNEDPLPFSSDMSGKESGKTLHKFKTTSMFSVSGDEDNVKCLEVVSIYYTLPRKHSKKFCNLLQKYTQNIDSLTELAKAETETFPNALEKDKLNYSTREQSGTPSPEDLKMLVNSAQENSYCPSHATEKRTLLQLPSSGPSEPTFQEMASVEADVSLHKGESKTREISQDHLAKTPSLSNSQSRKVRGQKLQSETLPTSSVLQGKKVAEKESENCQQSIKSGNSGPFNLPAHSEENVENSQTGRSSGEGAGGGIAITATGSGKCLQKGINDSANGLQPREVRREIGTDFQKMTDEALSDSESQVCALTPALHKLQLDEVTHSGEPDLESLPSEPRKLPQRSQEVNMTENLKAKDEMQKLAWDQPSLPGGSSKYKTSLDDLEKGKNRSSVKHRLAAVSKAGKKFPAKDLSSRRHVATIFPQSGNSSGFGGLSLGTPKCHPLSTEPSPKSTESTDESRFSNDGMDVQKSENPLQVTVISNREASAHLNNQKSNSISQPHQIESENITESPPKDEDSKAVTVAQILESESEVLAQPTITRLGEADFSDHPFPLEPAEKSINSPLASCQQQQRSASSLEREPEPPHHYRSKSLKNINVHGDLLRKSHPPKVRERHFSETASIDNALSGLTLGNEFSNNSGYSRRFKSFSELPSCDENENWALYNSRTRMGRKSVTSISRPIDYGIFGKEQQLAFLENVKRSLTEGRLWKPSFLKNPGFLKDDVINPSNPLKSSTSNSPSNQMPEDGLSPSTPLNIYEEDPVDSDCDTDTTTDDEYYLDENDKESEL
ncbi:exophilin-5 isoform X2 [Equus asinus]|uniref:exophilin-5 isoform X2 n=1 Tax=Equus asinus TaxID=9793 RepID=UPI001D043E8A|nr:exophilin-5 isoform X2 [Equus asinus]